MERETVRIDALAGAEAIESHGKSYALAPDRGGLTVYRVRDGMGEPFGGAASRDAALRIVEDDASGLARDRAERFTKHLDETVAAVREGVAVPMAAGGYGSWHMGGGCMAWGRGLPDGTHVLICTEDNRIDGDPAEPEWIVGRYGAEEGFVCIQKPMPLRDAMALSDSIPAPVDRDGAAVDVACDSLEEASAALEGGSMAP